MHKAALGSWLVLLMASVAVAGSVAACQAFSPPAKPESTCIQGCLARAPGRCNETQCRRGCRLSLDRLIEHEGEHVLACIASSKEACSDDLWAYCAARIGVHADGGPPAPPKPEEEE